MSMSESEYNALDAVRRSDLWKIKDSPEKYLYALKNPEEPTPALTFGQAAHKLLLEPESFFDDFAVAPAIDRRTKAGKEEYERFMAEHQGKTIITDETYATIFDMTSRALGVPMVAKLLDGEHERAFLWTDPDTGIVCKTRLDCLSKPDGVLTVVDYKTVADARTSAFNRDIFKYGYHLQAYMYTESVMQTNGMTERPDFVFIAQEKKPPYSINVVRVNEDVMMAGMDAFRECLGTLKECTETGYFWGYNGRFGEMNETELPGWMESGMDA